MAGFTVGVGGVVEVDFAPIVGHVAGGTLPGPVILRGCVAGKAIVQIAMIHFSNHPIIGRMAIRALPGVVISLSDMTGNTILVVGVVKVVIRPG